MHGGEGISALVLGTSGFVAGIHRTGARRETGVIFLCPPFLPHWLAVTSPEHPCDQRLRDVEGYTYSILGAVTWISPLGDRTVGATLVGACCLDLFCTRLCLVRRRYKIYMQKAATFPSIFCSAERKINK